jgi:hypothetical protein
MEVLFETVDPVGRARQRRIGHDRQSGRRDDQRERSTAAEVTEHERVRARLDVRRRKDARTQPRFDDGPLNAIRPTRIASASPIDHFRRGGGAANVRVTSSRSSPRSR